MRAAAPVLLAAMACFSMPTLAQDTKKEIQRYQQMIADGSPVELFEFLDGALPFVKVNVKMAETSDVRVIAEAGGRHFAATKEIKVTIGGCGG